MSHRPLVGAIMVLAIAGAGAGCRQDRRKQIDATGGDWAPVVSAPGAAAHLDPPPAQGSEAQRRDEEEVLSLQARRTDTARAQARFWDTGATVRWNEIARDLVAKNRSTHPMASRAYVLVSVAQYDALIACWSNRATYRRPRPSQALPAIRPLVGVPSAPSFPSEHAVVAAASASVLAYLYPNETAFLEDRVSEDESSRLAAGVSFPTDVEAGDKLGRSLARAVIERARADRSDAPGGEIRTGPGLWFSAPNDAPLLPRWGEVTPWLTTSIARFLPPPPPAPGSPEFQAALREVREYSDRRTPEQARIAALWADGPGSYAPAGRWNKIAADLVLKYQLSEIRAARVLTLLNMSMMDAGIACWDCKYHYLLVRPWQVDPAITTPVGQPNFPSYPSAHACFSGAGAEILGFLFPKDRAALAAKAEEAALSRVYGGIHYRFDGDAGLRLGRAIAGLAIERARKDGAQ